MSEPITMDREYVTRDGREVRIYATDANLPDGFVVVGQWLGRDGFWSCLRTWRLDGSYDRGHIKVTTPHDLIPKPRKHTLEGWVNVYEAASPLVIHRVRGYADISARESGKRRIACVHVVQEYTEGDGLADQGA